MFIFPVYGSLNMACQKRRVENGNNISSDEKLYLLCLSSLSEDLWPSGAEVQLQTKRAAVFQTMAEGLLTWNALFHLQTYKPPWRAGSLNSVKDRKKTLNQQTEDCRRCSETRSTLCWHCSEQTVAPHTINLNTPFFTAFFLTCQEKLVELIVLKQLPWYNRGWSHRWHISFNLFMSWYDKSEEEESVFQSSWYSKSTRRTINTIFYLYFYLGLNSR